MNFFHCLKFRVILLYRWKMVSYLCADGDAAADVRAAWRFCHSIGRHIFGHYCELMNVDRVVEWKEKPCSNVDICEISGVIPMGCSLEGLSHVNFLEIGGFFATVHWTQDGVANHDFLTLVVAAKPLYFGMPENSKQGKGIRSTFKKSLSRRTKKNFQCQEKRKSREHEYEPV